MKQNLIPFTIFLLLSLSQAMAALTESPAQPPAAKEETEPALTPAEAPVKPPPAPVKPQPKPKPNKPQPPSQSPVPLVEAPSEVPVVEAPPRKAKAAQPDVGKILDKAGGFSVFARILRSTQVINQIENQINTSNSLTILAPTNAAFAGLKPGTLNSLTTEQKVQLVLYHILPSFIALPNFQTLSNPVRTQASDAEEFPLNVTTQGNWVNVSTGLVDASISGTVYADSQLAVYKLDKVLLPLGIFAPRHKAPAPAPAVALAKPKKEASGTGSGPGSGSGSGSDSSDSGSGSGLESGSSGGGGGPAAELEGSGGVRGVRNIGGVVASVVVVVISVAFVG